MPIPTLLLKLVSKAVLAGMGDSILNDVTIRLQPEMAEQVWNDWVNQTSDRQRLEEIQTLAGVEWDELEPIIQDVLEESSGQQPESFQAATSFLLQIPSAIRRRFRRPENPTGNTIPEGWTLNNPQNLLALLPQQIPWFTPGDRPAEVGDWELTELMEIGGIGESWKARNPRTPNLPPVLLKFCLQPTGKERLQQRGTLAPGAAFDRILRQAKHPGLVQLQQLHLNMNPPCLEYEFFEGGTLGSLISGWGAAGNPLSPALASQIVKQLADILGFLHRLQPPLIHRHLNPGNVWLRQESDGQFLCKIADLGLSEIFPRNSQLINFRKTSTTTGPIQSTGKKLLEFDPQLYMSPEELRGEAPDPMDDVFSLGILWYQMLIGNLSVGRPGGSQWRRRLSDQGMSTELIELLESCFEDDPSYRPADGAVLAEKLHKMMEEKAAPPVKRTSVLDSLLGSSSTAKSEAVTLEEPAPSTPRARQRRADVWQLFDDLEKKGPELAKLLTNSLGIKFALIPAGTFWMGTPEKEEGCRENEIPRREVSLTRSFYMALTPVTQKQFFQVMGQNPARFHPDNGGSLDNPVESVTWEQAEEFCRKLSERPEESQAKRHFRLPTEAEWEYACRAGTSTPFCFGESLSSTQANFDGNFPYGHGAKDRNLQKTSRVGQFPANNFGLHDMHGNVWEWCADWLESLYYQWGPKRDPKGPSTGKYKVLRGGSWKNHAITCRSGYRNALNPRLKDSATGFRVVFDAGE